MNDTLYCYMWYYFVVLKSQVSSVFSHKYTTDLHVVHWIHNIRVSITLTLLRRSFQAYSLGFLMTFKIYGISFRLTNYDNPCSFLARSTTCEVPCRVIFSILLLPRSCYTKIFFFPKPYLNFIYLQKLPQIMATHFLVFSTSLSQEGGTVILAAR
jgi:hypothetical protein